MKPVRFGIMLLLALLVCVGHANARRHGGRYATLPRSEGELVNRVLQCLRNQDTVGYFNLFPPFDTLWHLVMHNPDNSPESREALDELKEHPRELVEFDPYYNPSIMERYCYVLQKGLDSGLSWGDMVLARYELQKQPITRNLIGYDKVAKERFMGYIFVRDMGQRTTYCITIIEMQKINGFFAGGQVFNIAEASTIEEYERRLEYEKEYVIKSTIARDDSLVLAGRRDSLHKDSLKRGWIEITKADTTVKKDSAKAKLSNLSSPVPDDDTQKVKREVVDRKYYEGKFDDEIPVELYVRYMRDPLHKQATFFDALYKFGDQKDYIRLEVNKTDDKWEFDDDPPVGSMELVLKNKIYTGQWTNNETQSGYDVVMKEMLLAPRKMEKLEKILEEGLSGRTDEPNIKEKKESKRKKKANSSKKSSASKDDD